MPAEIEVEEEEEIEGVVHDVIKDDNVFASYDSPANGINDLDTWVQAEMIQTIHWVLIQQVLRPQRKKLISLISN